MFLKIGPADHHPELLLIQLGLRRVDRVEEVPRVQLLVADESERRSVERVRAGLADQVDLVGAEPVLRRVRRRLFLELLDGVDGQDGGRRAERGVDVRRAVDHEVVRRRPRAHDADRVADPLAHVALFAVGLDRAGAEEQQLEEVAAVQRQLRDLLLGDDLADGGGVGVDRRGIGFDFDPFGDVACGQLEVDALDLIDVQLHVGMHGELEPGLLRGDDIDADREQWNRERALVVRERLALEPGVLVADRDLDLGHHRARGIAHDAGDLPGGCLGSRRTGEPEHDDQRDD